MIPVEIVLGTAWILGFGWVCYCRGRLDGQKKNRAETSAPSPTPLPVTVRDAPAHLHCWRAVPFSLDDPATLTSQSCACGALREYRGPAYGWVAGTISQKPHVFQFPVGPIDPSYEISGPPCTVPGCGLPLNHAIHGYTGV